MLRVYGAVSVDLPALLPSLPGRLRRSVVIRFELTAPVVVTDTRPGVVALGMVAACRRMTAANNAIVKNFLIVEPAVDADGSEFFFLIH